MKVCTTCGKQFADDQKFCPDDGSALRSAGGAADMVGSVIGGKFHIQKKLGEGGMGAVYLGEHVKMGRKCAIKVMTQSMANDPDAIARFNREATNASRINHPNVCAIYDFGEDGGLIYLAMEFIEGGSLSSLVELGPVPPARAARIIQQAGEALQAAHDLGIVHRDLKPDNIMLSRGRDGDVVKVVDFGIAKAMGGEEGQKVTKTGLVVGTPEYMSPEQLSGDKLDGRSDIYSLALVLYRMLTGTLPFQADSAQETMIKRLTDEPLPLNEAMPGANFPARLQQVIDRALQRMPSERYSSAAEFSRDAAQALGGLAGPVTAPSDTEGATQLMEAAKTEQIAATRVAGSRAPAKPGGKTAIRTPDTPALPVSTGAPEKKKSPMAMVAVVVGVLVVGGGAAAVFMNQGSGGADPATPATGTQSGSVTTDTANRQPPVNPALTGSTPARTNPDRAGAQSQQQRPTINGTSLATTGNQSGTTGTADPPRSTVDSTAVFNELESLNNALDDAENVPRVRARSTAIFNDAAMPKSLRAEAAFLISTTYPGDDARSDACRWIANALIQRPDWNLAKTEKQRLGC